MPCLRPGRHPSPPNTAQATTLPSLPPSLPPARDHLPHSVAVRWELGRRAGVSANLGLLRPCSLRGFNPPGLRLKCGGRAQYLPSQLDRDTRRLPLSSRHVTARRTMQALISATFEGGSRIVMDHDRPGLPTCQPPPRQAKAAFPRNSKGRTLYDEPARKQTGHIMVVMIMHPPGQGNKAERREKKKSFKCVETRRR